MKIFSIRGKAVNLFIKAESREEAARILRAPLLEVTRHLSGVWFEHK